MIIAALTCAVAAAALHVFIFYLESIAWTGERARRVFGTTRQSAEVTREIAFNQGFYNLFLGLIATLGVLLYALGHHTVAVTLIFAGTGSMLAAALVLFLSSPQKRRAAVTQGTLPLIAIFLLAIALAL